MINVKTLHTAYMLCARYVRMCLLCSVEWTPQYGWTLLCFCTQYFIELLSTSPTTGYGSRYVRIGSETVCEIVNVKVIVPVNAK